MTRFILSLISVAPIWVGCGESEDANTLDLQPLYSSVAALCDSATCGDYSNAECKRYVFEDSVLPAYFAVDSEACLRAQTGFFDCVTDAGGCDEDSCDREPMTLACAPGPSVPEVVAPADIADTIAAATQHQEDCGELYAEELAEERAEYRAALIALIEGAGFEYGADCKAAFVDIIDCEIALPCDSDGEEECAPERATLEAACQ